MLDPEKKIIEEVTVGPEHTGLRVDKVLSLLFRDYSRSFLQRVIRDGGVTLNDRRPQLRTLVKEGDSLRAEIPILVEDQLDPEPISLDVIYEDADMLAVNKPPDQVVHPSRGHARGTLANALLHHCRTNLSDLNGPLRPGIVHRLDRDTSGVILCAKSNAAHTSLSAQFKERRVHKEYLAVVRGCLEHDSGEIALPIGRDPRMRERMSVHVTDGRPAVSRYFVQRRYDRFTRVRVEPKTGRTHQIRVHMSAEGHPVAGDALYGGGDRVTLSEIRLGRRNEDEAAIITRQALHARRIRFRHPVTDEEMAIAAPIPPDLAALIEALEAD